MTQIWKYKLEPDTHTYELPVGAIIRHVGTQQNEMYMWVEVPSVPGMSTFQKTITTVGTGYEIPDRHSYLGTCVAVRGWAVIHVYEYVEE